MVDGLPIGTRIRKRRQELGLTQEELAGRVGVHASSVLNWEKGKHFPQRYQGAVEAILSISLDEQEDRDRYEPVSDELRQLIEEKLRGDVKAQRRVIGLLERTLTWPDEDGAEDRRRNAR